MKTLSIAEAKQNGFKTFRYGMREYLPVALPRAVQQANHDALYDILLEQFEASYETADESDARSGYCTQVIEDIYGRVGVRGGLYIARCHYDNSGTSEHKFYGAVKVS